MYESYYCIVSDVSPAISSLVKTIDKEMKKDNVLFSIYL